MKALVADGEWMPRAGYSPTGEETARRRALIGSRVWRNTRFEVKDVAVPMLGGHDLLIKVKSCGICGSDTHLYETDSEGYILFSGLTKLPCIVGHEFSGVIEAAGKAVTGFQKGDMAVFESIMWCGMCRQCRSGSPNQCGNIELLGLSSNGALAEYAVVNERYCWDISSLKGVYPEDEAFDIGALIEPIGCAYNGIFVAGGGFNPGSSVVVYGSGPIGLGAVALSRTAGASLIIAFDVNDGRVRAAKEVGADFAFNLKTLDCKPSEKVMELTRGEGADIQVEAAGAAPETIPEMEKSLSSQGKIIYLGRAATKTEMYLDVLVSGANKIVGARGHSGYGIFPFIIKLIASGRLKPEKMISSRYPFEKVIDALKASTGRETGKILVRMC